MYLAAALALGGASCGKKGPPLAPFVHIPAAVQQITARRSGNDVYITLTVPSKNVDDSVPVAVAKVDVIAYTGRTPPTRARLEDAGDLVATIPIGGAMLGGKLIPPEEGVTPGSVVTVVDMLSAEDFAESESRAAARGGVTARGSGDAAQNQSATPLRRFYTAVATSPRRAPGPPGTTVELALAAVPEPPAGVTGTYTATEMRLTWEPAGGTLGYLLENTELGPEPSPLDDEDERPPAATPQAAAVPSGPIMYNVYRVRDPAPTGARSDAEALAPSGVEGPMSKWKVAPPPPVNPAPIRQLSLTDTLQMNGHVCYTVRAARGNGPTAVESAPSEPLCVTPVDTFPPLEPRSLAALPSGGSISLIWEASDEPDVVGYLVLRGAPGDATLQPLTPKPIREARYLDASVKSGVRYVYAVTAVDSGKNVSRESNRVEDTAR